MMRQKLFVSVILILLLGSLALPLVGTADGGKAVFKEMVQSPGEYSVSLMPWDYLMHWGERYYRNVGDFPRNLWTGFRLYRLMPPPPTTTQTPQSSICQELYPQSPECWNCIAGEVIAFDPWLVACGPTECFYGEEGPWYCSAFIEPADPIPCTIQIPDPIYCQLCIPERVAMLDPSLEICSFIPCDYDDLGPYYCYEIIPPF